MNRRISGRLGLLLTSALVGVGQLGLAPAASAQTLPTNGVFDGGGGTITTDTNSVTVDLQDASRVINWDTFSIGSTETVSYITADTATQFGVLNRVITLSPSQIDGALLSQNNIAVWLVNPEGITFGSTGSFSGGSLVLTTAGVGTTDFLDGDELSRFLARAATGWSS